MSTAIAPSASAPPQRTPTVQLAAMVLGLAALAAASWWTVQSRLGVGEPVATDQVELQLNDFAPDAVVVPVGATVTWRFDGSVTHDIVGDGWGTTARSDGVFTRTFDEAGTFDYRCTLHGPMRGRVEVR